MPPKSRYTRTTSKIEKEFIAIYDKIFISFKDKDNGITVQQDHLISLTITENMFSLLPTVNIEMNDHCRFFEDFHIQSGDLIFITILPNFDDTDKNIKPILDVKFVIQTINYKPSFDKETCRYVVNGILAAEPYLNSVCTYPPTNLTNNPLGLKKSSADVIEEVVNKIGLKYSFNNDSSKFSDYSSWISCNETRSQFIDRLVSHAWCGIGNAPVLYTDKYGSLNYVTVKDLANKETRATLKDFSVAQMKRETGNDNTYLFTNLAMINASGPILNKNGYTINQGVYDPYNTVSIVNSVPQINSNIKDLKTYENEIKLEIPKLSLDDTDPKNSHKVSRYYKNESFFENGLTSKDLSLLDTNSLNYYAGMHFKEMHDHYEIAPKHNEMVRRSFFQNFVILSINTTSVGKAFKYGKKRPEIGDKYFIDFKGSQRYFKIFTGNFIVNKIVHKYEKNGGKYILNMYLSNDCYYNVGNK